MSKQKTHDTVYLPMSKKKTLKTLTKKKDLLTTPTKKYAQDVQTPPLTWKKGGKDVSAIIKKKSIVTGNEVSILQFLGTVSGVGPQTAQKWYDSGTRTLDDAAKRDGLSIRQRLGLKYYDDLKKRIPRQECDQWNHIVPKAVQKLDPQWIVQLSGSYRRGDTVSDNLNFMIASPEFVQEDRVTSKQMMKSIVDALTDQGIIVDTLSHGPKKFQGIAHIPQSDDDTDVFHPMRQICISIVPMESYWTGILHHTGSATFNQYLRNQAKGKQFRLSEYELVNTVTNGILDFIVERVHLNSEQEIFTILGEKYKEPHNRSW